MSKQTVELVQTNVNNADGVLYRVVKLTNTVSPSVGEHLTTSEIQTYIRRPGWTVIIKERKE
jgi:hypothetical protein